MKRLAALALLLFTAACSPLEQCLMEAGTEVRRLERQIRETRGNVERGYAIHRQTVPVRILGTCLDANKQPYPCEQIDYEEIETPVSIDIDAERRKLADQERRLTGALSRREAALAQCRATYPE